MKTRKTWGIAAALAAALAGLGAKGAWAFTSTATLDIEVIVQSNLAVSINGQTESTTTITWGGIANASFTAVNQASATVKNESGTQDERWEFYASANSIDQGSAGNWANSGSTTSVGSDQFALQAVLGSSNTAASGCPTNGAADWGGAYAPALNGTHVLYDGTSSHLLADTNLSTNGGSSAESDYNDTGSSIYQAGGYQDGDMLAGDQRALCWRMIMPSSVSNTDAQTVQLSVTAVNP